MLQNSIPQDYVIASQKTHSVRDFVECAFNYVGLDYRKFVELDPRFYRPSEKTPLKGDNSRIYAELGWRNEKMLAEIVGEMVENDLNLFSNS